MKLGFVSALLADLSFAEVFEFARSAGYGCVEVMCWPVGRAERRYAGVTHIDVNQLDAAVPVVQDTIDRTGVQISGLGYYPNALSPDAGESETAVDHIRKVIAATARLGLDRMNTFIGRDWTRSVDDNWPRLLDTWRPIVKLAEDHGVRIGIENCPMFFTDDEWPGGKNLANSPAIWRRLFADIPSQHLGLNYDPSHMIWQHMDYLKPMREFADRIFHVHAKDVRIDQQRLDDVGILAVPHAYHTPKLPGMGDVHWGRFFSTLTDIGYAGPVCVEVEDRAYEHSLDARKESLRQSARFLQTVMPTS